MNSPILATSLTLIALAAGGCMSSSESATAREPHVKPNLVVLTAEQAAQRGIKVEPAPTREPPLPQDLAPLDASAVITPPGIKVYVLNRAVDPADPELMHEEHVVYRRESAPRWRLDAPAEQKILVGPKITDGRQDLQPLLNKELSAFLVDQRRATESNQKAIAALFEAVDTLSKQQQQLARHQASGPKDGHPAPISSSPDSAPPDHS